MTPQYQPAHVTHIGADKKSGAPVVILTEFNGNRSLAIWVGKETAGSIAASATGLSYSRPLTHDILKTLLDLLNGFVAAVFITHMRNNIYFAELQVMGPDKNPTRIDSRPSDAIAIALRCGAPIYIADDLFENSELHIEKHEGSALLISPADEHSESENDSPATTPTAREASLTCTVGPL